MQVVVSRKGPYLAPAPNLPSLHQMIISSLLKSFLAFPSGIVTGLWPTYSVWVCLVLEQKWHVGGAQYVVLILSEIA